MFSRNHRHRELDDRRYTTQAGEMSTGQPESKPGRDGVWDKLEYSQQK